MATSARRAISYPGGIAPLSCRLTGCHKHKKRMFKLRLTTRRAISYPGGMAALSWRLTSISPQKRPGMRAGRMVLATLYKAL